MKFLKVAWDDLKKIKSNTYVTIAIIAVILVPLVYGGLYLAAFWDPYGHTENIDVAVVNLDKGTTNDNKVINAGEGVMEALKDNDDIGWKPVKNRKTALQGVYDKKYFAMITIPENFSESLLAAKDGVFEKPRVEFITNRKTNYIVSLINDKAAEVLRAKISASFAKAFTKEIFDKFHEVKDGLLDASEGSGQLKSGMFVAKDGTQKLNNGLEKLRGKVPDLESGVNQLFNGASDLSNGITTNDKDSKGDPKGLISGIASLSSGLYDAKDGSQELDDGVGELLDGVIDLQDGTRKLNEAISFGRNGKQSLVSGIEDLYDGVVNPDSSKGLGAAMCELNKAVNEGKNGDPSLVSGITDIRNGICDEDPHKGLAAAISLINSSLNGAAAQGNMDNLINGITELNRQVQLFNINNQKNTTKLDSEDKTSNEVSSNKFAYNKPSDESGHMVEKQFAALLGETKVSDGDPAPKIVSTDNKSDGESKIATVVDKSEQSTSDSIDVKSDNVKNEKVNLKKDSNFGEISNNTVTADDINEKAKEGLKGSVFDKSKDNKLENNNVEEVKKENTEIKNDDKIEDSVFGQNKNKTDDDKVADEKNTGLLPKLNPDLDKENGEGNGEVSGKNKDEIDSKGIENDNKDSLSSGVNQSVDKPNEAENTQAQVVNPSGQKTSEDKNPQAQVVGPNNIEDKNISEEQQKEVLTQPTIPEEQPKDVLTQPTIPEETVMNMPPYENPLKKVMQAFQIQMKNKDSTGKQEGNMTIATGLSALYNGTVDDLIPGIAKLNLGVNIGNENSPSLVEAVSKLHYGSEVLNSKIQYAVERLKAFGITKESLNGKNKDIIIKMIMSKMDDKTMLSIITGMIDMNEAVSQINAGLGVLDNNISTSLAPGVMQLYAGVTGFIPKLELVELPKDKLAGNTSDNKEKSTKDKKEADKQNTPTKDIKKQLKINDEYAKEAISLVIGDKQTREKILSSGENASMYKGIKAIHQGITGIDPANPYKNNKKDENQSNPQHKPTSPADTNTENKIPNIDEKSLAAGIGKIYAAVTGNNPITKQPIISADGKPMISPITQLKVGISALNQAVNEGSNGNPSLKEGIQKIYEGITDPDETKGLGAAIKELDKAINSGKDGKKSMVDGVSELHDAIVNPDPEEGLAAAVQKLYDGITIGVDGNKALVEGVEELKDGTAQLAPGLSEAYDGVQKLSDGAYELSDGAMQLKDGIGTLNGKMPSLANGVGSLADGSNDLYDGMNQLLDGSANLNSALTKGADKIADKLVIDSKDASDFASDAVKLKEKSMYEIKNYGTGFAPYFISLGLWVGALLMFFIISDNVDSELNATTSSVVLGKYLTYAGIGVIQAVGLSLFVMALGLRPSSIPLYIGFNVFLSLVFIAIIQNLIYLAGDVGRLTATVALLLQLTACGGTFPEQLLPGFFRAINPYVPFTYSVSALREIICGPDIRVLNKDIIVLLITGVVFLGLTLALKFKANKVKHHIEEKYSTSI